MKGENPKVNRNLAWFHLHFQWLHCSTAADLKTEWSTYNLNQRDFKVNNTKHQFISRQLTNANYCSCRYRTFEKTKCFVRELARHFLLTGEQEVGKLINCTVPLWSPPPFPDKNNNNKQTHKTHPIYVCSKKEQQPHLESLKNWANPCVKKQTLDKWIQHMYNIWFGRILKWARYLKIHIFGA